MNNSRQIISAGPGGGRSLAEVGELPAVPVDRVDLSDSVSFFRRRLGLILAIIALSLAVGAVLSILRPKVYTSTAIVSLQTPQPERTDAAFSDSNSRVPSSAYVDTQVEIITSREMATRVAEKLGLLTGLSASERREVIDELQGNVSAERNGESYALTITYFGADGEEAARRVNEFARQFTTWELSATRERNRDAIAMIEGRLSQLRSQAQADTAALQEYRIANNLLSTSGASLTEQEISSYNQEVTQAKAQAAEDQARLRTALAQLRSGSSGDDVGEALGSQVISSLRSREAEVGGRVANLAARYGPNHPELVRSKGELSEIREQIDAEIRRVISNLTAKQAVSQQRLASLTASMNSARAMLSQNNAAMVGLDELERNAQVSQGLYETYLNSYKQLVASEGTERPNARILTLGEVPFLPSSPNIPMNLALSLAIGLGLGLVAAFLAESFFKGITGPEQIERDIGERYLGAIPLLSSVSKTQRREVNAIANEPRSAFAEAFRSLRTSIEQAAFGPTQVIAIASALPKEGKTVTAICLAQTLAMSGARTLLVDCDEAKRGVSRLLELDSGHRGLIQVLKGEAELDEALINPHARLSILPVLEAERPAEALLSGEEMGDLIAALRERFDYIILDLPPVLAVAAARRIAARADATVMLVRWRKTAGAALQAALHSMPADRINVVGVAMTQVDLRKRSLFGHSDPSFYYRHYREYYA